MLRHFRRLSEQGDTIVEVLISIAVVSLILGGAFASTNNSLQATREAQEHGDALKLVESQIEQLKGIDKAIIFGAGVPAKYCIAGGVAVDFSNAACVVNADGTATTAEPAYHLVVTRNGNTFDVGNTWTNVRGNGQNSVSMKYRVYQ
jgi:type II secretory pathway pseudopilin PulG